MYYLTATVLKRGLRELLLTAMLAYLMVLATR